MESTTSFNELLIRTVREAIITADIIHIADTLNELPRGWLRENLHHFDTMIMRPDIRRVLTDAAYSYRLETERMHGNNVTITWNHRDAFFNALRRNDLDTVRNLLPTADPTWMDGYGYTALHYAMSVEAIRLLTYAGVNPNRAGKDGITPISFTDDARLINALIECGAEPLKRSSTGMWSAHPLVTAVANDMPRAHITTLLEGPGANINGLYKVGKVHFTLLALARTIPMLQLLLELGANPTINMNPLYGAYALVNADATRLLLTAGADPNGGIIGRPNSDNEETPLHLCSNEAVAHALVQGGADIFRTCHSGITAKVLAESRSAYDIAAVLARAEREYYRAHPCAAAVAIEACEFPSVMPASPELAQAPALVSVPSSPVGLCLICTVERANIVFLPCKHLCYCKKCEAGPHGAAAVAGHKTCPMCRNEVKDTIEIFLP
jgi:ankyrin repeat protein